MLTKEDLENIKDLLDRQEERLEKRIDGIEERIDRIEERIDRMEEHIDRIEERIDRMEEHINKVGRDLKALSNYTHKKFAWVENDMMLKITALFDGRELCVQHVECRRQNEEIQRKLAYIDPLVQKVREHGERLEDYDEILKRFVNE